MQKHWFLVAVLAVSVLGVREARCAGNCGCDAPVTGVGCGCATGDLCGGSLDCGCGLFKHGCGLFGGCGLWGHKCKGPRYEGLDPHFNCGCNGSYKFPVPPLYTYHWPGMWQQHLMTDYHSPWRFPPLKPYVDEVLEPIATGRMPQATSALRTVSHESGRASVESAPSFSRRLEEATR